ncbi:MAG: glycosyltransferase family 2 protein [Candidatus Electrothrix communis]|nr:MAG: glycosyltransferase family 2 protein [Candidatus Electrothrix communis]
MLKKKLSESLVTVIMPAYNAERYIEEAVLSVIQQTWQNWELIIVNDGSTDGTQAYLDALIDPRIKVIKQENKGVSAARNAALDIAQGKFVTFFDADDILPSKSLEVRVTYLQERTDVDIVDGIISARDTTLNDELRSYQPYYQGLLLPRLLKLDDRVFFGPFYMLRKSCIGSVRFREDMSHAEDLVFHMVIAGESRLRYDFVPELVYIYRRSEGTAMSNIDGLEKGYLQLLQFTKLSRNVSWMAQNVLQLKIAKILFLSWLSVGKRKRSISSLCNIFTLTFK